ncbi:MAG TPA: YidB family protein, partial [Ramlibacter sp.]|nr:YidB family protein [Ramlibacter sp.]
LGGMLGGRRGPLGLPSRGLGGNRTALMLMLLPVAMRWVQRNGGMGAVLDRFRQKGYGGQMQSWVAPGDNQPIDEQAVEQVVGHDDLQQMAQRLGVPEHEVRQAFAEVMPEMVDQLTPEGRLPQEADEVLDEGAQALEKEIEDVKYREVRPT